MMKSISIFLIAMCCMATLAQAQDVLTDAEPQTEKPPLVTDRPDQTEAALIVPKHSLQFETGFMLEGNSPADGVDQLNFTYNTTLVRFGVNEYFELRLIQNVVGSKTKAFGTETTAHGISPLSLGTKIKVADARKKAIPQTAFLGHLTFPTGTDEFDQTHISMDFRMILAWDLCEKLSMGINLGGLTDGENPNFTSLYTVSLAYAPVDRFGLFVESYGFMTPKTGMPHDHRFDAGITVMLSDMVQYDLSGGVGFSKISPDYFVSTGVSFRLIN